MPQIVLDPANVGQPTGERHFPILPPKVRQFGFVPDDLRLKPGDLVLSREVRPGWLGRLIDKAQRAAGFAPDHSQWTHAAVLLSPPYIAEALPRRGVVQNSLFDEIPNSLFRVRRRSALGEIDGYKIALKALSMLGSRYNYIGAVRMGWHMMHGLWRPRNFAQHQSVIICSKVFHDAYCDVTRTPFHGCEIGAPVTPAHLSATPDLVDVDVGWVKVAGP